MNDSRLPSSIRSMNDDTPRRSRLSRVLRGIHHAIFHASREGRSSEIVGWSNALASLVMGGGLFYLVRSWPLALALVVVAFVLLRVALTNRSTIWIAAAAGTLT